MMMMMMVFRGGKLERLWAFWERGSRSCTCYLNSLLAGLDDGASFREEVDHAAHKAVTYEIRPKALSIYIK